MSRARSIRLLRWLAVLPAALAGWYLALSGGIVLHSLATSLCPEDQLISGMCNAHWFPWLEQVIFAVTAALAAFLVVWLATLCCPAQKVRVATVAFIAGALVTLAIAAQLQIWLAPLAAIASGLLTLRWLRRRHADA